MIRRALLALRLGSYAIKFTARGSVRRSSNDATPTESTTSPSTFETGAISRPLPIADLTRASPPLPVQRPSGAACRQRCPVRRADHWIVPDPTRFPGTRTPPRRVGHDDPPQATLGVSPCGSPAALGSRRANYRVTGRSRPSPGIAPALHRSVLIQVNGRSDRCPSLCGPFERPVLRALAVRHAARPLPIRASRRENR